MMLGTGGRIWDSSMILAKYLCKNETMLNTKFKKGTTLNILELGSGTGILGIYAACLGWNVILSD